MKFAIEEKKIVNEGDPCVQHLVLTFQRLTILLTPYPPFNASFLITKKDGRLHLAASGLRAGGGPRPQDLYLLPC